jgi:hypothetical protein
MDIQASVKEQLIRHMNGGVAAAPFNSIIEEFPISDINKKAPNVAYSFWHLLHHIEFAQRDIIEYMTNPSYKEPDWPKDYWLAQDKNGTEKDWKDTVTAIQKGIADCIALIEEKDIFAPITFAKNTTIYRCVLLIANHNAYHLGEFGILRQVVGNWGKSHT